MATPASVSGRSVRPASWPDRLHAVSPCLINSNSPMPDIVAQAATLFDGEDDRLAGRGLALAPALDQGDGGGDGAQHGVGLGAFGCSRCGTVREGEGDGPQRGRLGRARGLVGAAQRRAGVGQVAQAGGPAPVGSAGVPAGLGRRQLAEGVGERGAERRLELLASGGSPYFDVSAMIANAW